MKYVIIGNSTAGVAAIEGIRSVDKTGDITVVSAEKHYAYGRPTISYCLKGDIKREDMICRSAEFYRKNGVETLLGSTAEKIDAETKEVVLSGGGRIAYDRLLIATGSRPFMPKISGAEKVARLFNFMTYDDMLALERALSKKKSVLVVGAGLIGLKCVEGIVDRVKSVTVVDTADRVLPSVLDGEGAGYVEKKLKEKGVQTVLNDSVERLSENNAVLKSGREIPFDILVVAVGVRANKELAENAGCECVRGIVIDTRGRTSLKDVYAAGDCAEGFDSSIGQNRVLALLPNAAFQGKCAGINMAGGDSVFDTAIPMNALGFFGLHILSAGVYEGECVSETNKDGCRKLFIKGNRLAGFILIGDISRAGIYTALIRDKTDLNALDRELILKEPQLSAFSAQVRESKLARTV